ncbi:hypothetical protein JCM11251_006167 [Rhodosporidiobolus azoricus]
MDNGYSRQEGPAIPAHPDKDTHRTAHFDKNVDSPADLIAQRREDYPSQWVEPSTRGTSDHMETGIAVGLEGGSFPAPGVEDQAGEEWSEQLSKSHPSCEPSALFPGSDPLSASSERPSVMDRVGGMMDEVEGWMKGDDELREAGRTSRKFGDYREV